MSKNSKRLLKEAIARIKRLLAGIKLRFYPVTFQTKRCLELTDKDFEQCSRLFSNHYGVYSELAPEGKRGRKIRMSAKLYKNHYKGLSNAYVTLAYSGKQLIGQAFFISDEVDGKGRCTWVTQLVVHEWFRKRTYASKLLQSAWGFSDDAAWGLATVNPMTLKVLEHSTFREINLEAIIECRELISSFKKRIPFALDKQLTIDNNGSSIDSKFFPVNEFENSRELSHYQKILGPIPKGGEWMAFVFFSQPLQYNKKKWESFMKFQESQLIDSYSRMNIPMQGWAAGHKDEVLFIFEYLNNHNSPINEKTRVLDIGCGTGRHLNILIKKQSVRKAVGIDFSATNIEKANQGTSGMREKPLFKVRDARYFKSISLFDLVLCLYDVIGSYREEKENEKIIASVKRNLKKGGFAFISVMNMEYTESVALHKDSLSVNPNALLQLKPSENMAKTGNVFDPDFFIINTDDGLVYRKEQFKDKKGRDAEYLIADKRYTREEMKSKLERHGLKVIDSRYVCAKRWKEDYQAKEAKEILFVVTR